MKPTANEALDVIEELKDIREHTRTCPLDHYSTGECVQAGDHEFFELVKKARHGKLRIDEIKTAATLRKQLEDFLQALEALAVRDQNEYCIVNHFDASHLSRIAELALAELGSASRIVDAAHVKPVEDQPGVFFWNPSDDRSSVGLAGAIDKALWALMWPNDRHNQDMKTLGRPGDRFRAGDVFSSQQYETLKSASASLKLLGKASKQERSVSATKRRPGRPTLDRVSDARVFEAWSTRRYPTRADLERAFSMKPGECRKALDRHRHRAK